jgi:sugar phosphate isomerase/epimerase
VAVRDVEAVADWLNPTPFAEDDMFHPVYDVDGYLEMAETLGASTLVAAHFGPAAPPDETAAAFGRLCDRAAERGLRVALEFPAFATVGDVAGAWAVVRAADRPNGGILLDMWHHRRSPATDADLAEVPADRIFSVQVSDAAAESVGTPIEDVVHRRLPGAGDLGVAELLRELDERGVSGPVGIEVLRREILRDGIGRAATVLHDSLAAVVAGSRHPTEGAHR